MVIDVDAYEVLTYLSAAAMAAIAILVLRTRPDRAQNRWFVGVLTVEVALALSGASLAITTSRTVAYWAGYAFVLALSFQAPVYLGFLSTLEGRVSRMLRTPVMRVVPWTLPAVGTTALLLRPSLMIADPDPTVRDTWATVGGPMFGMYQAAFLVTAVLALFATVGYWRRSAHGSAARRQGAMFALAFGLHDVGMVIAIGTWIVAGAAGYGDSLAIWAVSYYGLPALKLALVALVGYGILRAQLFDIELKVKWTVGRGAALAGLAVVFTLVKETLEFFLPGEGLMASVVGAIVISLLVRPAWAMGSRLADRVFPDVQATEQFLAPRRLNVFRASLESVAADGTITARERRMLDTLRDQLAIPPADAERVEREVLGHPPSRESAPGAPDVDPLGH